MKSKGGIRTWGRARWRYYLLLLVGVLLTAAFGSNIIAYAQEKLVDIALLRFESTLTNDILFATAGISFALAFSIKKIRLSSPLGLLALLGLYLYLTARISSDRCVFAHYLNAPFLAYADSILLLCTVLFVGSVYPRKKAEQPTVEKEEAIADVPIHSKDNDEFGFISIVGDLASFIRDNRPHFTRTIGVHGMWGAGKTSFVNLLREELRNDKVRFVDFTPWQSSDEPFATQLLSRLVDAIEPKEQELREELAAYSELLNDISFVGKFLKWFAQPRDNQPAQTKSLRKSINSRLTSSGYTYVVVVDDIDRLTGKEMLNVLKLVRSSADFHGLYYLLAYDRIEVNRGLESEGILNSKYFDKFVELEIGLPHVSPQRLGDFLVGHIDLGTDQVVKKELKESLFGSMGGRFDYGVFVATPRDAKRLALSTNVFYHRVQKDVTLRDAVLIQMLRMRFPDLLELFVRDFRRFLDHQVNHAIRKPLILKKDGNKVAIELALESEIQAGRLSAGDMVHFLRILRRLFPEQHWAFGENYNSVCYTDSFYRYFSYYLDGSSVSEDDYEQIITGSESVDSIAARVITHNQELSLCLRMEHGSVRETRWRIIEILFALGRASTIPDESGGWSIAPGSSTKWLQTQLSRHHFTDNEVIPPEQRQRFIDQLTLGTYPFKFERDVLHSLYGYMNGDHFIVSQEEIKGRIVGYVEAVIDAEQTWNRTVSRALADCHVREWIPTNATTHTSKNAWLQECNALFDRALQKFGPIAYCSWFLQSNNDPDHTGQYSINPAAAEIYGSWVTFGEHLATLASNDPTSSELLDLYNKFATTDFKKSVAFTPSLLVRT